MIRANLDSGGAVRSLGLDADQRQVKDAKIGMAQNMGGTGGSCVVHILGSE